jgi:ankyrin repeat protein
VLKHVSVIEQSQFLTTPIPAQPLRLNLSLGESNLSDHGHFDGTEDSDSRLAKMLASQARLRGSAWEKGEEAILNDAELSDSEKRKTLQDLLATSASNGEVDRVLRLVTGPAREFVDVNAADADGNVPIIYASCFGHLDTVAALVENGADIDRRDQASWSPLMWAITNRQKEIVKYLLDHGASPDARTMNGRTAFDFVPPNSDMAEYLHDQGYKIGNAGVSEDFYDDGFAQGRFEEEMAENEMRRRMMMESAVNLEVDLGNLTLDDQAEVSRPITNFNSS